MQHLLAYWHNFKPRILIFGWFGEIWKWNWHIPNHSTALSSSSPSSLLGSSSEVSSSDSSGVLKELPQTQSSSGQAMKSQFLKTCAPYVSSTLDIWCSLAQKLHGPFHGHWSVSSKYWSTTAMALSCSKDGGSFVSLRSYGREISSDQVRLF